MSRSRVRGIVPLIVTMLIQPLLAFTPMVARATACVAAPSGAASWWTGDGTSADILGGNHASLQGGPSYAAAKVGQGFLFDTDDDRATVADGPGLNPTAAGFTVEFWMKGVHNQPHALYDVVDKSHGFGDFTGWTFQGTSGDGHVAFIMGNGSSFGAVDSTMDVLDGAYHHVAGSWDGASVRLYVDGVLQGTLAQSVPANNTRNLNFGYSYGGSGGPTRFFRGNLDEVTIYGRALSPSEIQSVHAADGGGKCRPPVPPPPPCVAEPSGMVAWWAGDNSGADLKGTHPVSLLGGSSFQAAKVGAGFVFDSNDDRATIGHVPDLNMSPTGFTVDFWAKGIKNQPESIFLVIDKSHGFPDTGWAFQGVSSTGQISWVAGSNAGPFAGILSAADILDGSYHHVAGTWDGTTMLLYVDGVLQPGSDTLTDHAINLRPVNMAYSWGGGSPQRFFRGNLDETHVYSRALSASEIQAIHGAGSGGVCKTPPPVVTSVSHSPASPTDAQPVTLQGDATDETGVALIEVYLDGTAPADLKASCSFSPVQSPAACAVNVGTLAAGAHLTTVKAYDGNGGVATATESFSVTGGDTAPPAAPTLLAPDDAVVTDDATPTFDWSDVSDPSTPVTYGFQLDGDSGFGSPDTSVSGLSASTFTPGADLADGTYYWRSNATDGVGNVGPYAAARSVNVDTTAPDTTITSSPTNPTSSTSATFAFTATETATFECSFDGAAFAACTSPVTYSGLAEGAHTFQVRATDAAGNTDASPASFGWTVDLSAPVVTITSGPTGTVTSTSATFTWSVDDGSPSQCRIDGAAYAPCASPVTYSGLADGAHTFDVRAIDAVGHVGSDSRSWTVDATAPDTSITSGPANPTSSTSAAFTFTSTEAGSTFACSLDGAAYTACTSPKSYTGLAAGPHAFAVKATDAVGNTDATPATFSWTITPTDGDTDGDGVPNSTDQCVAVAGTAFHRGCPSSVKVTFQRHTVGQGSNPGSTKEPVVGAIVRAFDRNGACVSAIGTSPRDYATVYTTCAPFSESLTDANGVAVNGVVPANYLVISRDPVTDVYAGVTSGNVSFGAQADKQLQVIVRANGTSVPAKTTTYVGSLLHVIEPEYVEWNEVQELYPFVFDAPDGDWNVSVTVTPPEGFTVDHPALSTDVNNDYKALQFTLTDVGSCWKCGTDVRITIKHLGKTMVQRHNVKTPMTEWFAQRKGLTKKQIEHEGITVVKGKK